MKIFIGVDKNGDIFIVDKREMMPDDEKMMRIKEMDIPARGWKRKINVYLEKKWRCAS